MDSNTSQSESYEGETQEDSVSLPTGTPDWGVTMFNMLKSIRGDIRSMSSQITAAETRSKENTKQVATITKKLEQVEKLKRLTLCLWQRTPS